MKFKGIHEKEIESLINKNYNFHLRNIKYLPIGEDCASYLGKTEDGEKIFITVYQAMKRVDPSRLDNIIRFLRKLNKEHSFDNVLVPIKSKKNKLITFYKKFPVVLFEFIVGEHPKSISQKNMKRLGQIIGKLHNLDPKKFKGINNEFIDLKWQKSDLRILENAKKSKDKSLVPLIENEDLILQTHKRLRILKKHITKNKRKYKIVHTDLYEGNLLVNKKDIFIIDWDAVQKALPEKDLMWFSKGVKLDKSFEKEYKKYRKNFKLDKKAMEYYILRRIVSDIMFFIDVILTRKMDKKEKKEYVNCLKDSFKRLKSF
tara:strand:- start:20544 stop:21491 length:948 start_codon:yes stop_codon:yes gene_type:complete